MEKKSFNQLLKELEGCKDITPVVKAQKSTLLRYEEINEMLRQFLELSDSTQSMLLENYTAHAKTLIDLKKDLEASFRRIRALKGKLKDDYPDSFEATSAAIKELEDKHFQDDEERYDQNTTGDSCDNRGDDEDGGDAQNQILKQLPPSQEDAESDVTKEAGDEIVTPCTLKEIAKLSFEDSTINQEVESANDGGLTTGDVSKTDLTNLSNTDELEGSNGKTVETNITISDETNKFNVEQKSKDDNVHVQPVVEEDLS